MGDGNESQPSTSSSIEWSQPCRPFEFPEILSATNNFDESLVIGHGGFGKVYKGNIINGSSVVVAAIKRLDSMSSQGASEFWAEVKMLSKLRHCHLVSLFGYCNHDKEMIIIYEYMPNGTLEDHLHKLCTHLSWIQRLKICIGTARVYSFGVVLLEVLCRKRAVDRNLDEEQWGLVSWAQESIKEGNLKNIIDSGIRGQITQKCLKDFMQITERCLHNNPKQRPTMAEVVVSLDFMLTLQQKVDTSLQTAGKKIYGKMINMFPFPFHGENSAHDDSRLSSNSKDDKADSAVPIIPSLKIYKFSDLEMITKNFSQDLVVDRDCFGEVYLGWVDEKTFAPSKEGVGILVAVKNYNAGLPKWKAWATMFGKLAHPNIIRVLGFSNDEKSLLVYEHMQMPNRNFSRFLFGDVVEPLSWETRLLIMIGVARGLTYMHSSEKQVVHGGIKTFNILLDENFNAKLGYFGLPKFQPNSMELVDEISNEKRDQGYQRNDKKEDATTSDMDIGRYVDRTAQMLGQLTLKSDIYCLGVVLFETLTSKRSYSGFTLVNWIKPFLEDKSKLKGIIDHRLNQNFPLEGAFECLALATRCVAKDPNDRPSSEKVLKSLEQIYFDNK